MIYTFRGEGPNAAAFIKSDGLSKPSYIVDFTDGLPGSEALTTVTTTALDANSLPVTGSCISTSTISGNQVTVAMLTCGAGGTSAPTNGARFKLTTTATCTSGKTYLYDVYVYIQTPTYGPIPV